MISIYVLQVRAHMYHCLEVKEIDITDYTFMFSIISSKKDSLVVINAGEGETSTWRRPSSTDNRRGPHT